MFSIKKQGNNTVITIFGIKLKIRNYAAMIKRVEDSIETELPLKSPFIWANIDKYTTEEKIWLISKILYSNCGYFPNLKNPKAFNEKLNWLKLNYYNPEENICIDKHLVKDWVKEKIGDGYTIPLLGVYKDVNDIDFEALPTEFIVKSPFSCGAVGVKYFNKNKGFNVDKARFEINEMKQQWHNVYYKSFSRGYKEVEPKIIIEKYMPIREGKALEYKMFCFHGEMKFSIIECDYFGKKPKRAFYDKNFVETPFKIGGLPRTSLKEKPEKYDEMVEIAEKLSANFPIVRVDFYVIENKIYLGEMSFTSGGGYSRYEPFGSDYDIGEWLDLKKCNPDFVHIVDEFKDTDLGQFFLAKKNGLNE